MDPAASSTHDSTDFDVDGVFDDMFATLGRRMDALKVDEFKETDEDDAANEEVMIYNFYQFRFINSGRRESMLPKLIYGSINCFIQEILSMSLFICSIPPPINFIVSDSYILSV